MIGFASTGFPLEQEAPDRVVRDFSNESYPGPPRRRSGEAIESKDRLMASLAHELRNPLSGVVGFTSILTSEWDSMDDDTRRELSGDVASQVGDVSMLLDDFLTFEGDHALRVEDTLLSIDDVLMGLDLSGVNLDMDPTLVVRGDAVRIRQIIRNLVRKCQRHGGAFQHLSAEAREEDHRDSDDRRWCWRAPGPGRAPVSTLPTDRRPARWALGLEVFCNLAQAMGCDLRYRREGNLTIFELGLRSGDVALV